MITRCNFDGRRSPSVLAFMLASACAGAPVPEPTPGAPENVDVSPENHGHAADCGPPIAGLDLVLERPAVLVGEVHGTEQGPDVFGRIVCQVATARSQNPILVGLEISHGEQERLDGFMEDPDAASARATLLAAPHFRRPDQDGRGSRAMLALLERLRELRHAGLQLEVVAFDTDVFDRAPVDRDATMAENLRAALARHPNAMLLSYSGRMHNRIGGGDSGPRWMGEHLISHIPELVALDFESDSGTSWCCTGGIGGEPLFCGEHAFDGRARGSKPFIELHWNSSDPSRTHHGIWYVGALTASPPAVTPTK